jgi:hypothetical protein
VSEKEREGERKRERARGREREREKERERECSTLSRPLGMWLLLLEVCDQELPHLRASIYWR